jgi:Uma2 family endonuclease
VTKRYCFHRFVTRSLGQDSNRKRICNAILRAMQAKVLLTADEFLALPNEEDRLYDLDEGEMIELTRPGPRHGVIASRLGRRLAESVDDQGLGVVIAHEVAFRLNDGTVRSPDVAILLGPKVSIPVSAFSGSPDIAIEVVSPSDYAAQLNRKRKQYFAAGSKEVWIVEPEIHMIQVYSADGSSHGFESPAQLTTPLIPNLRLDLAAIFA